jgi:biopolymer transport protein ExbD
VDVIVVVAGLGMASGVIVTIGAVLDVPQAERTTAIEQNRKQSFIKIDASREISYFWSGSRLDLLAISQIKGKT